MRAARVTASAGAVVAMVAAFAATAEVAVTDDAGQRVILAQPAQRIVSLAPHATELLFAAGAGARVVGVVAHSDWPPEARRLPGVGDANALDLERIVALAPDLVVAWPYTMPAQLAALRARGATIFVSDPKSIAGIAHDIEGAGNARGHCGDGAARGRGAARPARRAGRQVPRSAGDFGVLRDMERAAADDRRRPPDFRGDRAVRRQKRLCRADIACAYGIVRGRRRGQAGCHHRRQRRWTAPDVARRLAALARRAGRALRQPVRRQRRPAASLGTALRRWRRGAVRDARPGAHQSCKVR